MAMYLCHFIQIDQGFNGFALEIEILKLATKRAVIGMKPVVKQSLGSGSDSLIAIGSPSRDRFADLRDTRGGMSIYLEKRWLCWIALCFAWHGYFRLCPPPDKPSARACRRLADNARHPIDAIG